MPSQHKHPPVSFRPPEADRAWLYAYAEQTGQPVNRVLAAALAQYRRPVTGYLAGGRFYAPGDVTVVRHFAEDEENPHWSGPRDARTGEAVKPITLKIPAIAKGSAG